MKQKKGNEIVPFFIYQMNSTSLQETLENMVSAMLEGNEDYFLVDLKIRPGNNIKVVLDADSGVSIDKCVDYNRYLYKQLETAGLFPDGDFSLEVSSPGVDEPLKLQRQYRKNLGRQVEILLKDGSKREGKLSELTDNGLVIEETRSKNQAAGKPGMPSKLPGRKKELVVHNILFSDIKTTKVQVVF
ncbi:MAG TPA: ribosome maturation factor [Chitinophagaceae bacterium]|nr:ribosome maturation factor [Chitinophagaceae bacterium]